MCVLWGDSWNIITQCPEVRWLPTPEKGENGDPTVAIFFCLSSSSARQLRGTTSLRNQECRLSSPPPHLTLARALAQATTLERAGAFCSWILGVMFQESLLLMGVELSETHGFGIQKSIRFWQSSALSEHRTMCISGSDKSCLTLPRLERPCQFCHCSPDVVFAGAATAGLYISFAEEGTVTGAM